MKDMVSRIFSENKELGHHLRCGYALERIRKLKIEQLCLTLQLCPGDLRKNQEEVSLSFTLFVLKYQMIFIKRILIKIRRFGSKSSALS
jgi:hypothetical protein